MNGDLSLSQSLGGLRIANPDDSPLQSEDATADSTGPAGPPAGSVSTHPRLPPIPTLDDHATSFPPAPIDAPATENRSSVIYSFPDAPQPASAYQPYSAQPHSTPPNPNRPLSSVYTNGSVSSVLPRDNSYRMRTDSGASSTSTSHSRLIDTRGGSAALQAGVPARDNSHSDRSYRTAQIPTNGPVMRQSSRAHARGGAAPQMSRSPYGMENGPTPSSEDWQDRGAAVAVRQEVDANGKTVARYIKKGVRDFSFGNTLGEGSYSTVVFATDRQTLKEYAIKILDKRHIIKEKKVKYVNIEKDTLNRLTDHPGIVRLYYTFQDERSLYFVLDLCKGGELLGVLKRMTTFDEECTRFYGAQILDTIDYMHKRGVIHRDLKPENVLLDHQMYVKITDFGTAKILKTRRPDESTSSIPPLDSTEIPEEERASSFVGTAEYVSPELLTDKNACKASDLWAFGCIIYQLLAGRPPFKAGNEYQTFQKIVALDYEFPVGFPAVARDLVERLLVLDPARRLQIEHIKNHEFFDGISWGPELWKQKAPRLKAYVPPPREPIKLNGEGGDAFPPSISTAPPNATSNNSRALPRVVTELPPPSQLDIEWSPVLSKSNERILKLGNMVVLSSSASHSPTSKNNGEAEAPKKFSRFFSGSATKKRSRLVMVTSSARIILAAAGGDEKKAKLEISLLAPGTHYRSTTDAKGHSSWIVDTRDKHYVFEDPKPTSSNIGNAAVSTQEWLDALDRAREMGSAQQSTGPYSAEDAFRDISSGFSSHANTLDRSTELQNESNVPASGRNHLVKHQGNDSDSVKGKKRFSKRHSKNGLAAVF
ncbi:Serine/threonine-protein kinase PKH2 [Penicillium macrosclerotiorum]|uniref:Serine/threonine-protein kinase PKH2 n=1 Tax=Penicillium macrosclerotiorum TaxID=303699 RepID=UPI0025473541|nr:Serine/threonine-protein kinase PKH2 [Penicillium macrosclerotiorum]KAJ5692818.1 Serine/threonine-protein kinase PKH2 [Penicillium macrosclerotiorum]